ncbi:MAG: Crp/Fnr family transcriptional regulator [Deltaproteobacteria bacterium]|nr:MAG: Crp/Fnr family transcriptional regulator [Deltaproteobacteria bacterium]
MARTNQDIISNTLLFQGLGEKEINRIGEIAVEKNFNKGDPVFFEGEDSNGFYIIGEGLVKIYKLSIEGKEQILHILGPGEPFGEVPVFSGQRFPANAETITKSQVLFFPRPAFTNLITRNPSLALNMLAVLSVRLRQFTTQIENLSLKEVPARLAGYLIYLAEEQGNEDLVTLNISKGQLASLLGTVPETLSRVFARMNTQNLIEVEDRRIAILDRDRLTDLAESGKNEKGKNDKVY